ncbi:GW domain-containing glycosaminoglycan-binding protein [Bacillus cereus]|uniref:GW domain-containing glycosaminoglycan-binding protein n=1 Tax=Bacillus cereus TaxID=1396 RepID=UPI003D180797
MGTMDKLVKTGKSAIVGTVGVGVLLSTTHSISADTIKPVDEKVQGMEVKVVNQEENNKEELQVKVPDNGVDVNKEGVKPQTESKEVEEKVKVEVNKENKVDIKQEVKPELKQEEKVQNKLVDENKPKTDSLQVVEEKKVEDKVEPQLTRASTPNVNYEQVNVSQIIEKSNNDGIWSKPYGLEGANWVGSVNGYVGKVVKITERVSVDRTLWYKISLDGKEVGWVDAHVMSKATDIVDINESIFTGVTGTNHGILTLPWGMKGSQWVSSVNDYAYQELKATKKTVHNGVTWYQVSHNGKVLGWMDKNSINTQGIENTNFTVTIGNSDWHAVWSNPYGVSGSNWVNPISAYAYQKVQVVKTAKIGQTNWYQVKNNNGILGWIDGGKATTTIETLPLGNTNAVISKATSNDGVFNVPWGEDGANWLSPVSKYLNKQVKVLQRVQKHNVIWAKVEIDGKLLGWVDAKVLSDSNVQAENKTVVIGDTLGHALWTLPYGQNGSNYVGEASSFTNKPLQVKKSMVYNNVNWYNVYEDGRELGWLDARAVSNATNVKRMTGAYHITTNDTRHGAWTRPFGFQNAGWVDSLTNFTDKNINAEMSIDFNGTTWIGFKNQGRMNWLDKRAISEGTTSPRMNVPIESQLDSKDPNRNLETGCEITAVSMMLQYAGVWTDKILLAFEMPYHSYDPNKGYVGSPWGDGPINTIYPSALTGLVKKYTGSAVNLTGGNLNDIKNRLNMRHPVVAWVGNMHGFGIHAITLTGYDNDKVYYNDPWTGEKDASMSLNSFNSKWTSKGSKALSY